MMDQNYNNIMTLPLPVHTMTCLILKTQYPRSDSRIDEQRRIVSIKEDLPWIPLHLENAWLGRKNGTR